MSRDLKPQQLSPAVAQDQKREQSLKGQRRDHAHINSSDHLRVVSKKRPPGLRRRPLTPHHVFGDRRLGDFEPQHQQFAMDPGRTPERISLLIRRMRSRSSRSTFGRPALFRDFQRQNALKPERCHRKMVSGFTTRDMSSRPGQIRVIHTNNRDVAGDRGIVGQYRHNFFRGGPALFVCVWPRILQCMSALMAQSGQRDRAEE